MKTEWFKIDAERIATLFCDSGDPKLFLANEIERAMWEIHDWHKREAEAKAAKLELAASFIKEVASYQESAYFSALAKDILQKLGYDKSK